MTLQQLRDIHWEWNAYLKQQQDLPESPTTCRNIDIAQRNIARLQARAAELNTINAHWLVRS